jgi:parvulin-like peptidyl-prolyl isomerase
MRTFVRICGVFALFGFGCLTARGQEAAAKPEPKPPDPTVIAATVNGQPIPEVALFRGLRRVPPEKQAEARAGILDYLIDNTLLDQYLTQLGVTVPSKDIDTRLAQVKEEIQKGGQTVEKVLQAMLLTEEELKTQLTEELRWEKFVNGQANDKLLHELFEKNPEMFDGTMVRARHILLTPPAGDAQAAEQAQLKLASFKKQITEEAAKEDAGVPGTTDAASREKIHNRALEDAFAGVARKESACPSKERGGDLDWFPRAGSMVEPFARAAFAIKPFEMTDPVATRFGYHLILVTDRRPGKETKFDDVKDVVKEIYADRLRDAILAQVRPKAKIMVSPPAQP